MPLTYLSLLFPAGRLRPTLFGTEAATQEAADALLTAVLLEHPTASEPAQKEAVYARAYRAKADDLNAEAASVDIDDKGSRTMLQSQIAYYTRQAAEAEARAAALLPAAARPDPFTGWPSVHALR